MTSDRDSESLEEVEDWTLETKVDLRIGEIASFDELKQFQRSQIEVGIGYQSESNFYEGYQEVEGVFAATDKDVPLGVMVDVIVYLPHNQAFRTAGKIKWKRGPNEAIPGVGIEFVSLYATEARMIQRFRQSRGFMFVDVSVL